MRLAARTSACRMAVVASTSTIDRVLDIDQVVGGVGEEGLSAMSAGPARRWIGRGDELGRDLGRRPERGIVQHRQILVDRPARGLRRGRPFSPSTPFCRLASALIRLASTAKPSPPTSRSRIQRRKTVSNTRRKRSLSRKRPCLFLEKSSGRAPGR